MKNEYDANRNGFTCAKMSVKHAKPYKSFTLGDFVKYMAYAFVAVVLFEYFS